MSDENKDLQQRVNNAFRECDARIKQFEHTNAAVRLSQAGREKAAQKHAAQSEFWGSLAALFGQKAG